MSRDPAVLAWALATNQRKPIVTASGATLFSRLPDHGTLPGYVPAGAIPVHVSDPDEARVLADLEVSLRECRALGVPWRVDAAFVAAAATVLDALGGVRHA